MSLSELTEALHTESDLLIKGGQAAQVPPEQLRTLVSTAVRLYAAATEGAEQDVPPIDGEVSTTDVVVMACALLKAENLNPFDLALWFSRSRVAG